MQMLIAYVDACLLLSTQLNKLWKSLFLAFLFHLRFVFIFLYLSDDSLMLISDTATHHLIYAYLKWREERVFNNKNKNWFSLTPSEEGKNFK